MMISAVATTSSSPDELSIYTPLREDFNLRCYIQHLMDESEDETQNPLSEENWMKQNN